MIAPAEPMPSPTIPEKPKETIIQKITRLLGSSNQKSRQQYETTDPDLLIEPGAKINQYAKKYDQKLGDLEVDILKLSEEAKTGDETAMQLLDEAIAKVESIIAKGGSIIAAERVLAHLKRQKESIVTKGLTRKDKFLAKARAAFTEGKKKVTDFLGSLKLPKLPNLPNLPNLGLRKPLTEQVKDIRGIGAAINADIAENRAKKKDESADEAETKPNLQTRAGEFVRTKAEKLRDTGSELLGKLRKRDYQKMKADILVKIGELEVANDETMDSERTVVERYYKLHELLTDYLQEPNEEKKEKITEFMNENSIVVAQLIDPEKTYEKEEEIYEDNKNVSYDDLKAKVLPEIELALKEMYDKFHTPESWQQVLEATKKWFAEKRANVKLGELIKAIQTDPDTQMALLSTAGQTIARALTGATGLAAATGIAAPAELVLENVQNYRAGQAGEGVRADKFKQKYQEQTGANEKPFVMKETALGRFFQTFQEFGKLGVRIIKLAEKAGQRGLHGVDRKLNRIEGVFGDTPINEKLQEMLGGEQVNTEADISYIQENISKILEVVRNVADLNLLLPEKGRQRNLGERVFGKGIFGKGKANEIGEPREYINKIEQALQAFTSRIDTAALNQFGQQGEHLSPETQAQISEIRQFLDNKPQYLDERAAKLWRRSAMVDAMAIVARGAVIESLVRGAEFASNLGGETPVQAIPPEVREDVVPRLNLDTDPGIGGGMPPETPPVVPTTPEPVPAFEQAPTTFAEGLTGQVADVIESDANKRVPIINMFKNIQQNLDIQLTTNMTPNINSLAQAYNEVFPEGANVLNYQLSEHVTKSIVEKGLDINQKPLYEAMFRQAQGIEALPGDAALIQTALSRQS